jgi:hypothetical protein
MVKGPLEILQIGELDLVFLDQTAYWGCRGSTCSGEVYEQQA